MTSAVIALLRDLPAWFVLINPAKSEILPYDNTPYQISIKYPQTWNLHEKTSNLIYITLQERKVYIESDGMKRGITQDLIADVISKNDIF